ncbi:hypothetical protein AVEN_208792-1 [Araneus ventricosus]|uniref:Uncharacterized protein n=1 Tax=Araneus ventricosus TaxID=182803 RepID=A0A4Y2LJI9_ARAVE|nr:hypothetical protein AVEN_208792-1 [Araneus ventricosus]
MILAPLILVTPLMESEVRKNPHFAPLNLSRPWWPSGLTSANIFDPIIVILIMKEHSIKISSFKAPSRWCGAEVWREGASSGVVLVI